MVCATLWTRRATVDPLPTPLPSQPPPNAARPTGCVIQGGTAVRFRSGAMVAGAVALTLLAACSSKSGSPGGTSSASTSGGYNAAVNSIVNPSTHKGGVLKIGSTSDADSYDPARAYYA